MLTHEEIREELIRQLDAGKQVAADVARKLGIAPARVTEMRKGERRVQQGEMPKLAALLGMIDAPAENIRAVEETAKVRHLGEIAQGVWLEQSFLEPDPDDWEYVDYDRSPGDPPPDDLFAVTPVGTSMNLAFKPGTRLICRRVVFGRAKFKSGSYVIAERTAHDLYEMTCKRIEIDDEGVYWLHSETDDDRYKQPWRVGRPSENHHSDTQITVVAKVVREVVDHDG